MAKPKTETAQLADAIVAKASEELKLLLGRNWGDINTMLEDEGEISIAAKVVITKRPATPGEQAAKDDRIKITISFAKKFSDSIEAPMPDPTQPDLPMDGKKD